MAGLLRGAAPSAHGLAAGPTPSGAPGIQGEAPFVPGGPRLFHVRAGAIAMASIYHFD